MRKRGALSWLALLCSGLVCLVLVCLVGLAEPAPADEAIDAATRAAIQAVISQQLDAFEHDNGAAAEALAAPGIRDKFPEPTAFLAMVKGHYAALIHPKSTSFGAASGSPHGPLQSLTVVAADGTVWTAIYSFAQVDGAWRITGCGLRKNEGQQDI